MTYKNNICVKINNYEFYIILIVYITFFKKLHNIICSIKYIF